MSFSPKDDSSVHLFHLSAVKSPKLNFNQTDKQTTPLKQENAKTFVSIADGSCPIDGVKYNHYTDSDYTEGSSSKGCKHKDKSKHHYKEHSLDTDDGSSSPFKDASLSNSMDGAECTYRKVDKEGKVVKKHKLKHKEKEKYRKEYESERNQHRQKEPRKDGHRNTEFDREFWKENFFKSDDNEDLGGKCETPGSSSPPNSIDSSPVKEQKVTMKDKQLGCKERRPKDEREKEKVIKKEKKEVVCKEERGKEGNRAECDDRTEGLNLCKSEEQLHNHNVKEEAEEKPVVGNVFDQPQMEIMEKTPREKNDRRPPAKDRDSEKCEKKQTDKEKKVKSEHFSDKSDLYISTERGKDRDRFPTSSGDKSNREMEKLKGAPVAKKHDESKKSKDRPERRSEKDRQEREHSSSEFRDKDRTVSDKKGKVPERTDHGKTDRVKEKDRDSDKRKKEKTKDSTSSSSNLKLLLEEKKGYNSENNKTLTTKLKDEVLRTPEKERDRRDRDRDSERHRDRERDKHREKDRDKEKPPQNRDGKLSKVKSVDFESKSKVSSAPKDMRPKEKRLVNDDLMQTSFERMLSLKDQEIEQWHKKHLEKIKQKERERLKQRPLTDPCKQKSKDKPKPPTSSSSSSSSNDMSINKELLRSKSSEMPESSSREKNLKEATSGRTMSLDGKNLSNFGKVGPFVEISRSPRPDSERSSVMSRSVSMISVASSEDSCQAAILTPRPSEYDSDLNIDAPDSQPPFLQSSLLQQSSRSPGVHEKDATSLPNLAQTSLTSRHASPYLKAILDEDAKPAAAEPERPVEGPEASRETPLSAEEPGKNQPIEANLTTTQEWNSSQSTLSVPEGEPSAGVEAENSTSSSQSPEPCTKDVALHSNLSQTSGLLLTTVEVSKIKTGTLPEQSIQNQPEPPESALTEGYNKDSLLAPASQCASALDSQPQTSSNFQWNTISETNNDHLTNKDLDLKPDQMSLSVGPVDKLEESTGDIVSSESKTDGASSPGPSVTSSYCSVDAAKIQSTHQHPDRSDPSPQEDSKSGLSDESFSVGEGLLEKSDCALPIAPNISEPSPEEPMDVSEEGADSRPLDVDATLTSKDDSQAQSGSKTLSDMDVEMSDLPDAEDKSMKPDGSLDQPQSPDIGRVQVDPQTEHPSGTTSGSSSPLSVADRESDSSGARSKAKLSEDEADVQVAHPRKRKMPKVLLATQVNLSAQQIKEKTQQSLAAIVDSLKLEEIEPYQTERANPYYEFLHIRKKIEEKRKVLCSVIPQAPQYYDEYVTFNGSYLLDGNPLSKLCIPTITPPPSLPEPLKEMFKQQEVVRMKLRLQHSIEREKLIVSNEQEVLRVHYRAARTLANQTLPFSACTVLLDAEVYNMPQDVQGDDGKTSVRDRFNARQFMSWLQDVDDKFDKLKTCLLMRQQHEAAALNAVQRLEWQLKLQELDPATYKSTSIFEIPEFYIPLVEVNDDFDLTPI